MGFFGLMGLPDNDTPKISDREQGLRALRYYYDEAKRDSSFQLSFEELVKKLDDRKGNMIDGLGLGITVAEISNQRVQEAMETLAQDSRGGIPQNSAFTQSLSKRVQEFDLEAFTTIAKETAKDTAKLASAAVGTAILYKIVVAIIVGVAVKKLTSKAA